MMSQWLTALIGVGVLVQLTSGAFSLDTLERPRIAEDVERNFNGRFLFTTNGDGSYVIYQKVERASDIAVSEDNICMLGSCYIIIDVIPSYALNKISNDQEHFDSVRRNFKVGQDIYERALRASAPEKDAAERIWREQISKIGRCLRDISAC